ncbi:MAG: YlxR family protein [Candidatus Limnocylindrales bacterium]
MVRTPDGGLVVDASGRLAGRGAYLCVDGACRRTALDRNLISRALERPLSDNVREYLAAGEGTSPSNITGGGSSGKE